MAELTFLMGRDRAGTGNPFYALAKRFFDKPPSTVIEAPLGKSQTLEGVIKKLNELNVEQGTINLVSHAMGYGAMQGSVTVAAPSKTGFMTSDDLQDALANKSLAPPKAGIITPNTRIVIYGCDVGRSGKFLTMLAGLFGNPPELLAPRRMGIFRLEGTDIKYRQAQSWSLVRKPPPQLLPAAGAAASVWSEYRNKFVTDAHFKFGRIALPNEPPGPDRLEAMLKTAAKNATTAIRSTFFLLEAIDILPDGTQTALAAAQSVKPLSNGDPPTALPTSALELDDTTVVTTVTSADTFRVTDDRYVIAIVLLGQVMDGDVLIAEGPNYVRATLDKALAPSPGPKPTSGGTGSGSGSGSGGGSGAGAFNDQLQSVIDELLAAGAPQTDIDALLAAVPQGDASEGLATTSPDEPPVDEDATDPKPPGVPA